MGEEGTLSHQIEVAEYIKENSDENDKVLSLSAPEILFLAEIENMNKYPLLESQVFIFHTENTGELDKIKSDIMTNIPKFIIIEESTQYKQPNVIDTLDFKEFIDENYKEIEFIKYIVYEKI